MIRDVENSDRRPFAGRVRNTWKQLADDDITIINPKRSQHDVKFQDSYDYESDQMHVPFDKTLKR